MITEGFGVNWETDSLAVLRINRALYILQFSDMMQDECTMSISDFIKTHISGYKTLRLKLGIKEHRSYGTFSAA